MEPTVAAIAQQADPDLATREEAKQTALLLWAGLTLIAILIMAAGLFLLIHRMGRRLRRSQARKQKVKYHDLRGELDLYVKGSTDGDHDQEPDDDDG